MSASFKVPNIDTTRFPIPLQPFINGKYVDTKDGEKHTLKSSINDSIVTNDLQWSGPQDVEDAVVAAEEAVKVWQAKSRFERRDILLKFADLIRENVDQIYFLDAIVTGKPKVFGQFEVMGAVETLKHNATALDSFPGDLIEAKNDSLKYTLHQPYGVTAAINPFNAPLLMLAMKVGPSLAAGNAIIVKTSELNPLGTLFVASLTAKAGFPDGLINILTGGVPAGAALSEHMRIRKISFTGSINTGKLILAAAAKSNLKRVTLELGGKSPNVIFNDADLARAAAFSANSFVSLNGQGCVLPTRLYIQDDVADAFLPELRKAVEAFGENLGADPMDPTTTTSPLFHHRQKEIVLRYLESGKKEATLLTGGNALGDQGCYIQPTVFVDPAPDAKVLKEEIFGPVLVVVRFKTEEEVIALANDTEYGLGAYVWTQNTGRALRLTRLLDAGSVIVNGMISMDPTTPFGGWKQSGLGYENGREGLQAWMQTKTVIINS